MGLMLIVNTLIYLMIGVNNMTYKECFPPVKLEEGAVFMSFETKVGMKQLFLAHKEAGILFDTMGIPLNSSEKIIQYIYI